MAGVPEFRKSQGVVPFGVGSIVDFPDESLMPAGLDVWPSELAGDASVRSAIIEATRIIDQRLQRRLTAEVKRKINFFLSPTEAPDKPSSNIPRTLDFSKNLMPFVRFPTWHFCPRCRTLWQVPWNTPTNPYSPPHGELKCHSQIRLNKGSASVCGRLPDYRKPRLIPVRFVVACRQGHISDFPWQQWAHMHSTNCGAGSGKIFLVSTGASGLAGLKVVCSLCRSENTLSSAYKGNAFDRIWTNGCPGDRPWLGPAGQETGCPETPQTIQRGASNAYFAKTSSSILIPPYSERLRQVLDLPDLWAEIMAVPLVDGKLPRQFIDLKAKRHGLDCETFYEAVTEKYEHGSKSEQKSETEEEYRAAEYEAFLRNRPPLEDRIDFDNVVQPLDRYTSGFQECFDHIVLLPKLRETRVLTGFSRVEPPEVTQSEAALSVNPKPWFPAMEVRGEGIFLVLSQKRLRHWQQNQVKYDARASAMHKRLEGHLGASRHAPPVPSALVLVHTFAHLLIRQFVFDCGYDSSALRERLYVSREGNAGMVGLLIYTSSGDAEGTLGGLVRQGTCGRLEQTVFAAIENARFCSTDPLCSESEGQGVFGLNLAACHACTLLPETACEFGNTLLDRVAVVGTHEEPELGFFHDIERIV